MRNSRRLTRFPPSFVMTQEYRILDEALKAFAASQLRRLSNVSYGHYRPWHRAIHLRRPESGQQPETHQSCRLRLRHDIPALLAGTGFLAVEEFLVGL